MSYILTQVYKKNSNEWIYQIFYNTITEAKNVFDKLTEKYNKFLVEIEHKSNSTSLEMNEILYSKEFKNNNENIFLYIEKEILYRKPNEAEYNLALAEYEDTELAGILYNTMSFYNNGEGMEEIEPKWAIWDMPVYACAKHAVETGRYKIIPTDKLPKDFPYKYYGWIDTPENRHKIALYAEDFTKKNGRIPTTFDLSEELTQNEYTVEVVYSVFNSHKIKSRTVEEAITLAKNREEKIKNPLLTTSPSVIIVRDKEGIIIKTIA